MPIITINGQVYNPAVKLRMPANDNGLSVAATLLWLPGTKAQKEEFVKQYHEASEHDMLTTADPVEEYMFWLEQQDY